MYIQLSKSNKHGTNYDAHMIVYFIRRVESQAKTDRAGHLLGQVKTGISHLAEKLQYIKAVRYKWLT